MDADFNYIWPVEDPVIYHNFDGKNVDLYKEIYGALSQNSDNPYSRISIANSTISIDPTRGCPLGCAYCVSGSCIRNINKENLKNNDFSKVFITKPEMIFDGVTLLHHLVRHPAFIKDKTVISLCTSTSEPFFGINSEITWSVLKYMADHGYKNPFWLVTKFGFTESEIGLWVSRFKYLSKKGNKIILSISWSNLPKDIEPFTNDRFKHIHSLKGIPNLHISHHFRPIINGINDSKENIEYCLKRTLPLVDSVCIGGLRVDPGILLAWKYVGGLSTRLLPENYLYKNLHGEFMKLVEQTIVDLDFKTPIFMRTSKMISHACGWKSDYNLYEFRNKKKKYFLKVPLSIQKKVEEKFHDNILSVVKLTAKKIRLNHLDIVKNGEYFYIRSKLHYAEVTALVQAIGHYGIF